jgi:hypothetical protein
MLKTTRISCLLGASVITLAAMSNSAYAVSPLEGKLFEDVTFDCSGTLNYLIWPRSKNPAFVVGHVRTTVDIPDIGSWSMSGVVEIGRNRGENHNINQETAPLERCFGRADVQFGECSTFSGVNVCQAELLSTDWRIQANRGNVGMYSVSSEGSTVFSMSAMGTGVFTSEDEVD